MAGWLDSLNTRSLPRVGGMTYVPRMPRVLPPSESALEQAANMLRGGGLVGLPTETVYGLGANALDSEAVARIFAAKRRPATNPLIVHVLGRQQAAALSIGLPRMFDVLAEAFWPGPLTLVVDKSATVPDLVTAGGSTVALRSPRHRVARELLQRSGLAIAAPSANRANMISPSEASHVVLGFPDLPDLLVLDGGVCDVGIESTVVDVTGALPIVLRPGSVSRGDIAAVLGIATGVADQHLDGQSLIQRSPGVADRHYAPRAKVVLDGNNVMLAELRKGGQRVAHIVVGTSAHRFAHDLYRELHEADAAGVDVILIDKIPDEMEWEAIADRLRRAAG